MAKFLVKENVKEKLRRNETWAVACVASTLLLLPAKEQDLVSLQTLLLFLDKQI